MLTDAQVAARKQGIGASESVILFPEIPNSYSTPYQLWMLKTGRAESDFEMNDFQWWGHELEPPIAKRYEYETGETLEQRTETFFHPKLPFMLCHPDRFVVGKRKLVEIKTAQYNPDEWGEPGSDHIPPAYLFQVQHQLAVTGYDEADLIVFFMNYRNACIYHIKRDNELIEIIETAVSNFWNNHVLADNPPEVTTIADCKMKFRDDGSWVDATSRIEIVIENLNIVNDNIKADQKVADEFKKELLSFIGNATGVKKDNKVLATWKADKNGKRTLRLSEK